MNNTVYDVDFTQALPEPLKNDENILALGKTIAEQLKENIRLSRQNIIYPRIDELEESTLDILAHDLHIDWYDPDSPPEVKREIIKDSVRVHKRMGTKYAVESVVAAYFGGGEVREWYEYGGEPHHFKVISSNPSLTDERAKEFFRILDIVKRKSSWLDTILITLTGESSLFLGIALQEFSREAHLIGPKDDLGQYLSINLAGIYRERTAEAHIMGTQESLAIYVGATFFEDMTEKTAIGSGEIRLRPGAMLYIRETEQHTIKGE
jgi:phage tail protein, P2 protein I family